MKKFVDLIKFLFQYWLQLRLGHLPFLLPEEKCNIDNESIQVSVARCAQSAYAKLGNVDPVKDRNRYMRLIEAKPMHASPLEHVATPKYPSETQRGNFDGWHQWRHFMCQKSKS